MPQKNSGQTKTTWNPENVFTDTASYYARYRPAYPDDVISLLRDKFRLTGDSRILDLGCGPGQIALKLAPYVSQAIALDPQEEMLKEGKRAAVSAGISNITWLKGESGKLKDMAAQIDMINLTVIARAFHWMDREQTLTDLYRITQTGGGVAVITDNGPTDGEMLPWKRAIVQTVQKWVGVERKAGTEGEFRHPGKRFEEYLKESEFHDYTSAVFQIERSWMVDEIIGYMYSTSLASPPVLGDKKEPFEADLRQRLREIQPEGRFKEPVTINVMMVWKKPSR
jgi:ubiquinone/menaquinone biosynthesis C-methylase UbiE